MSACPSCGQEEPAHLLGCVVHAVRSALHRHPVFVDAVSGRVRVIADESFGPLPCVSDDEALTIIERGIFELRQENATLTAALTGLLDAHERCQHFDDNRADGSPAPLCTKPATHSTAWTDHEFDRCEEHSKGAERCSIADAIEQAERVTGRR